MFSREYQIQNEINEMTTHDMGYTANNVEEGDTGVATPEQLCQALENFANASIADRTAFEQLTGSNAMLEEPLVQMYSQNINLAQ